MSDVLINSTTMTNIANAIRTKSGTQDTYLPSEMPSAINNIPSGNIVPNYPLNNSKNNIWIVTDTANQNVEITVETSGDSVNWGDGTTNTSTTHTYSDVGIYCISANSLASVTNNKLVLFAEYNNNITLPSYQYSTVKKAKLNNSSLTSISNNQFNTSALKEISMPYVTTVGIKAFYSNTNLTSFDFSNISEVGYGSFANTALTGNLDLSHTALNGYTNSLSNGVGAFEKCINITSVTIGSMIGDKSSINHSSFSGCTGLISATILGGTFVGKSVFYGCTSLTNVSLPNTITDLVQSAFYGCTSLTNINIPTSVTSIGAQVFYNCSSLTTLTIPASVTQIKDSAFYGCISMQEYHFLGTTPPALTRNNIFQNIPANCIIYVPAESVETYKTANIWSNFASHIQAEPTT